MENTQLTPGPMAVGVTIQHVGKWLGRHYVGTGQVTEFETSTRWAYKTLDGPYQLEMRYHFEPAPSGTRLTMVADGEDSGDSFGQTMPTLTPSLAFRIGFIVAPILFVLSAYFTRANPRRIAGSLVAAVAYSTLNILWDRLAAAAGWWVYPFAPTWVDTVPLYIPAGLVAGSAFGLIGWRVSRRWPNGRGLVVFLLLWGVWGVIHDFGGLAITGATNLMTFGPGPAPVIADFLAFVTCGALAQLAIRLVAGPAGADSLARVSRPARAA